MKSEKSMQGQRLDRAQGCLIGQLAGDALGGQVEFSSAATIRAAHPDGVREIVDGGRWRTLAGQPTDDSEMALALARTIARDGRYDADAAREAYVRWYRSGPFDMGGTTARALGGYSGGPVITSEANGSMMRASPLAVHLAGRDATLEELVRLARADSALTHPSRVCQDACAVYVATMAVAIHAGIPALAAYRAALDIAEKIDAAPTVRGVLARAGYDRPEVYGGMTQGWVLIALQNAFYQLLHAPSAEEGIVDTVGQGGDTDTNACIAGALLGAVHGKAKMPDRWLAVLRRCEPTVEACAAAGVGRPRPREYWPTDVLELAEKLLAAGAR